MDSAINFSGSADLQTAINPPPSLNKLFFDMRNHVNDKGHLK